MRKLFDRGARVLSRLTAPRAGKHDGLLVSVIVPVYNTENYLREMLDSIVAQDLPTNNFEVIAVNDGSTDSSGTILGEYAQRFSHIHVIHQENSGWAGKPRNIGLGLSHGKYVFFADADDLLAPQALRRMVDFAEQNRLEVVLPKVVGIGGRKQTSSLYSKTNRSVSPLQAMKSLTPQKLVARSLIESNNLRFAEEPVRLEDGMFMVACYLKAKSIGVVADIDFYSLRQRADGSNISYRPLVPHEYTGSIKKIAAIINSMAKDQELAESMLMALWTRKGLKIYEPPRFRRYSETKQNEWLEAHSEFLDEYISDQLSGRLNDIHHRKTEAIRRKDKPAVLETNDLETLLTLPVTTTKATVVGGVLQIRGEIIGSGIESVSISTEVRGKRGPIIDEIVLSVNDGRFAGDFPQFSSGESTLDLFAQPIIGELRGPKSRLVAGQGNFGFDGALEPYRTKNGYVSVRNVGPTATRS